MTEPCKLCGRAALPPNESNEPILEWECRSWGTTITDGPVLQSEHCRVMQLEGLIKRLTEALQALYDEQNGPPLSRYAKSWQAAMDQAQAILEDELVTVDQFARLFHDTYEKLAPAFRGSPNGQLMIAVGLDPFGRICIIDPLTKEVQDSLRLLVDPPE